MDFILSIEIVILALSAVAEQTLPIQIVAVTVVAFLATVGVYGIVALLVRMDDAGLYLMEVAENLKGFKRTLTEKTGRGLVLALPKVIRLLSIVGTLAMLLVGGGIFVHNLDSVHHAVDFMPTIIAELLIGLVVGVIALVIEKFVHAVFAKKTE
jgi:predicted DNA repair protein MutK